MPATPRPKLGRRRFLLGAGSTSLVVASGFHEWLFREVVATALTTDADGVLTAHLYRPSDQLWLRYEFVGLRLSADDQSLEPDGTRPNPTIRVVHAPQHLAEAGIGSTTTPTSSPVDHRVSNVSVLVFRVDRIAFTATALLGLSVLAEGTQLELPTDLVLEPVQPRATTARSDVSPATHGNVTQVHRTIVREEGIRAARLTAVQNLSRPTAGSDDLAARYPNSVQRTAIVDETSAVTPIRARRLWLTPLGASADLEAVLTSLRWTHEIRNGRDEYVEVASRGHLLPFGHAATWVDTSTRQWIADRTGETVAIMVERQFIAVDQSTVTLPAELQRFEGREMPFAEVTVEGHEMTPASKETIQLGNVNLGEQFAWVVRRDHPMFPVRLQATYTAVDVLGNPPVTFSLPMVFVADGLDPTSLPAGILKEWYADKSSVDLRTARPRGDVAWAREDQPGSGATTAWTEEMVLTVDDPPSGKIGEIQQNGLLALRPAVTGGIVRKAELGPPGVHPSETAMQVVVPQRWLEFGTDPLENPDGAFLDLIDPKLFPLGGTARAAMNPDILAGSLNQVLGIGPVVEQLDEITSWDPAAAFGNQAKILRNILISALVDTVQNLANAVPGIDVPGFEVAKLDDRIETSYRWCPRKLKPIPLAGFTPGEKSKLCIEIETVVALDLDVDAEAITTFTLTDFTLTVPPVLDLIELDVATLRAVQSTKGATDFVFDVVDWRLGGNLNWLQPLVDALSGLGASVDLDVGPTSIDTSFSLTLGKIPLGALEISGIAFGIESSFPYTGNALPTVAVTVGSPSKPLSVKYLIFKGGFFCRLDFSSAGLEKVRVRVEISAELVSIETALVEAHCSVGIAAEFRLKSGDVTFIGEAWVTASFDVAGLVGASLELKGSVRYDSASEMVTLTGRVLWSVTVLVTVKGEIDLGTTEFALGGSSSGGGGGTASVLGPFGNGVGIGAGGTGFGDQHDLDTWTEYVGKFAAA